MAKHTTADGRKSGGELGPSVNKQREGTKGNKIHFLTPYSLFFQDRQRFSVAELGRALIWPRGSEVRGSKSLSLVASSNKAEW